jgi:cytochrome c553
MKIIAIIALSLFALPALSVRAADAKANWTALCVPCHGADGSANTNMGKKLNAKNLSDAKVQSEFTDAQAATAIKEGVKEGTKVRMKAFGDKLNEADIKALVAYVRTLKK